MAARQRRTVRNAVDKAKQHRRAGNFFTVAERADFLHQFDASNQALLAELGRHSADPVFRQSSFETDDFVSLDTVRSSPEYQAFKARCDALILRERRAAC